MGLRPDAAEMQKFSTTKPPDAGGISFFGHLMPI
jgi:hypothetical protein